MIDTDGITASIDRSRHEVLVVDDNPASRYTTSRILQAAGFKTCEAGSGGEALAMAVRGVSAVVLDVHLPDMSGFDVCRRLRAAPETASLPIVHLSAEFTRDEDRVAGLDAGADGYLIHPVEPTIIVATLQALIRARAAEERSRSSEVRFRAIYDNAPSGIALLDNAGLVVDVNHAMERLIGYARDQLLGRPLVDLAPPDWRVFAAAQLTGPAPGGLPWQGQFPLLRADGRLVHMEWNISSDVNPGIRIAIANDASERVQLELQRRDVLEREQAARATAERHSRTKDDFIAVLSHELRTPLNAIVGWVAVLMRRNPTADAVKGLDAIDRNVKSQARIISDILDVSRISSGKLRLEREQVDPSEVIANAVTSLQSAIADKKLEVELALVDAREPAWLDPARFQQIFWNLMTNAIKFSPEGGLVRVRLDRRGPLLLLRVQDFGRGIEPGFMDRLFDRFSQSDAPDNRLHGGLGLGLSIVRHLAELHGGVVRAHSDGPGMGTTMEVELMVEPQGGADAGDSSFSQEDDGDARPLEGLDILVVEDDADASEMLAVVLADRGARVRLAIDYDSAVTALSQSWPDVLLSDIGLPKRDGYELIRHARTLPVPPGRRPLAAVALTAFARAQDRERALEAGFDDHVAKPLNPHVLVLAIRALRGPHPATDDQAKTSLPSSITGAVGTRAPGS